MANNPQQQPSARHDPNSGRPETGSGEGRKDVTGHTNVYPMSGPLPPEGEKAKVQQMGTWGQGDRGSEGYQDSGSSEILPPGRPAPGEKPEDVNPPA